MLLNYCLLRFIIIFQNGPEMFPSKYIWLSCIIAVLPSVIAAEKLVIKRAFVLRSFEVQVSKSPA